MRSVWPLIAVFLVASAALAQRHQEQITVNVVEVPVYVELVTGGSVAGLSKENFELYVNGASQPIDFFDTLGSEAASLPPGTTPSLRRRRLTVFLFDLWNSSVGGLRPARRAAADYVASAPAGDTFAVATLGRDGIQFAVPFTTDRVAVQRGVGTLSPSSARDPLKLATLATERVAWGASAGLVGEAAAGTFGDLWDDDAAGITFEDSRAASSVREGVLAAEKLEAMEVAVRQAMTVDYLAELADRLAPLTGIKHVILLTEKWTDSMEVQRNAVRMHGRYRSAGVILDVVDVAAGRATWIDPEGRVSGTNRSLGPSSVFYTLALDTGGSVAPSLSILQKNQSVGYVLGFTPHGKQKKRNSIRVKVRNVPPGTKIRYRRGYSIGGETQLGDTTNGLLLADVLMNDIPQNGMTVDVAAKATGQTAVITAAMPGRELLARKEEGKPFVMDVFLYLFDERNVIAAWSHQRLLLDLERGREYLSANPYTILKSFDLPSGHYSAKALVRVVNTTVSGFQRTDFEIK